MKTARIVPRVVAGLALVLLGPLSVSAQDVFEPDDAFAMAKAIANGQTQNRSIHAVGDLDYAYFQVVGVGAQNVWIQTTEATEVWLIRGSTGQIIAYDFSAFLGDRPRIEQASLSPGTYYIKVRDDWNNEVIPAYQLSAGWTDLPAVDADLYEPDNSRSAAHWIARGRNVAQRHNIHRPGDVDWVKFTVGRLGAWRFKFEVQDSYGEGAAAGDSQIWLYRADGRQLAFDDDSGASYLSKISLNYLAPGTYYGKIQEKGNNGRIRNYDVYVDWRNKDVYEPDNTLAAAARIEPIEPGIRQRHNLYPVGDKDWIQIQFPRGAGNVVFETSGARGDTILSLYTANGVRIGRDDDSGTGRFSRIFADVLAPGTYFARIEEKGNNAALPAYTFRVRVNASR